MFSNQLKAKVEKKIVPAKNSLVTFELKLLFEDEKHGEVVLFFYNVYTALFTGVYNLEQN